MNNQSHETEETGKAFRAGITGMPLNLSDGPHKEITVVTTKQGPIEREFETIERLPGLSEPEAAYETGRALRCIASLLDQGNTPQEQAHLFLDGLTKSLIAAHLNGLHQPWGCRQTAELFIKANSHLSNHEKNDIRSSIVDYARRRPGTGTGTGKK